MSKATAMGVFLCDIEMPRCSGLDSIVLSGWCRIGYVKSELRSCSSISGSVVVVVSWVPLGFTLMEFVSFRMKVWMIRFLLSSMVHFTRKVILFLPIVKGDFFVLCFSWIDEPPVPFGLEGNETPSPPLCFLKLAISVFRLNDLR